MSDSCANSCAIQPKQSMVKAVLAGSIGNALEWFDYGLYGYFATMISANFFPSKDGLTSLMLTFIVFGVGFVMRPLGGLVFGHYADRVGRRNALTGTIILMGLSTFAIGCLPTYAQVGFWAPVLLTVCRLVQGISTGGEWGSCMSFLAEYSRPDNRGYIVSWSQFSIGIGLLLGSSFGVALSTLLTPEAMMAWGWRIPFLSGILICLFGMYIRRQVDETPRYKEATEASEIIDSPLKEVVTTHLRETILSFGIVIGWTISYWLIMAYMPTYMSRVLKLPMWMGFSFNTLLLLFFMAVVPFTGILADKIGRKPVILIAAGGFVLLSYPLFSLMGSTQNSVVIMGVLLVFAFLEAMICGGATVAITEIFPTNVRCSAIAIGYNIAVAMFGGTAPFVSTWLISYTGSNIAPTFYLIAGSCITILAVTTLMEETKDKPLK